MKRKILSIIFTTALFISMMPTVVYASSPLILHEEGASVEDIPQEEPLMVKNIAYDMTIGDIVVQDSGYWLTDANGSLSEGSVDNYNIAFDASSNTLTLKDATIHHYIVGSLGAIYIEGTNAMTFNIIVEGDNNISTDTSGISLITRNSTDAILNISGTGKLNIDAYDSGIIVQSDADVSLNITDIALNISSSLSNYSYGIKTRAGANAKNSLIMDGSNYSSTNYLAVCLDWKNLSDIGEPILELKNDAVIDAKNGKIVYGYYENELIPASSSDGIIKDGKNTKVYGNYDVKENISIAADETLTITAGATLNNHATITNNGTIVIEENGKLVNNGKIDNFGTLPSNGIDNLPPTITTDALADGEVGKQYSQIIETASNDVTSWSIQGSYLDWLSISDTGTLSGTPTNAGEYSVTLVAGNEHGTHNKTFTLHIDEAPSYYISLDKKELDFGTVCPDYATLNAQPIEITNNGTKDIEVMLPTSNNYLIVAIDGFTNDKAMIAPSGKASFSIVPKTNLGLGNYDEIINVIGDKNIDVKFKVEHALTKFEAKNATCTSDGNIEYYKCEKCGKYFKDENASIEINEADTIIKASGHTYGEPTWTWTSDTQAKATFKCEHGDDIQEFNGIMSSKVTKDATCDGAGIRTYTAKVEFKGKEYTATKDIEIAKLSCASFSTTYDDGGPFTRNECGDVFDRWGNLIYDAPDCVVTPKPTSSTTVKTPEPTTTTLEPIETEDLQETSEPQKTTAPSPSPSATTDALEEVEVEKTNGLGFIWWIIGGIGLVIVGVVIYLIIRSRDDNSN